MKLISIFPRAIYSMADEQDKLPKDFKDSLKEKGHKLPRFTVEYDSWYSEAIRVVKQIIPGRRAKM